MWCFDRTVHRLVVIVAFVAVAAISGCQFQPLYGSASIGGQSGVDLSTITIGPVSTREAQQVRNHLLFLFIGGGAAPPATHELNLRVTSSIANLAVQTSAKDTTAARVTITASYMLSKIEGGDTIARGSRNAFAAFDRTTQDFANLRAEREAQDRAAREVAEQIRLAIAAEMSRN